MNAVANFLDLLRSRTGFIYGLAALLLGFVCGILISRWRRTSVRITRLVELEEQFVSLDEELNRIVDVSGRIWEKANPGSSDNAQTFRPKSYRGVRKSWIKALHRATLGKVIKKITKRKKRRPPNATSRLAASVVRLKSQTNKLNRAESLLPQPSRESPKIRRTNDAGERHSSDTQEDFDLHGAASHYHEWRENREGLAPEPAEDRNRSSQEYSPIVRDELLELYNHAVTDNFAREEFRERYQPIRLGTVNAVERRQNPTAEIKPEFRETTDGDFFAFRSAAATTYRVVPRLGLTVGAVSYNAGALGEMFGNPTYDPAQSYSHYQVRQSAIFKREGDKWLLDSPGQLDLGDPD
jgi:hypothetical protein